MRRPTISARRRASAHIAHDSYDTAMPLPGDTGDAAGGPVQGVQRGSHNTQNNYFAAVNVFTGTGLERLADAVFDAAPLARDLDLEHFTGRERLIDRIDAFTAAHSRGYIIVQAEAGVGKSALAAHLVVTRGWLYHFTRLPGGRSPAAARRSLAAQLIGRFDLTEFAPGGELPPASERSDWFDRVLAAAARRRLERGGEPIVLVVDGLDEAPADGDTGLPLGLPASLPDGVFVLATSRFGADRALAAVRNPADWLQIEVEGADNLADMRRFLDRVLDPGQGDPNLLRALRGVDVKQFSEILAARCAGVWIYLRYVLDEIRDGTREASQVGQLPADLAGFYAQQIYRWQGDVDAAADAERWEKIRLPLLATLAAIAEPVTTAELSAFAGVPGRQSAEVFVAETARAFLVASSGSDGQSRYGLRHQSLRDLLTGQTPADRRPDVAELGLRLSQAVVAAHRRICAELTPSPRQGQRDWSSCTPYAQRHLAAHAAAAGLLDELLSEAGFLARADPAAVLLQRGLLATAAAVAAVAAFELCLDGWAGLSTERRLIRLNRWAARLRALPLADSSAELLAEDWRISRAWWSGVGHRVLTGHQGSVQAVALGRVGGRDVIVSGGADGTVRMWDQVAGQLTGRPLTGHEGSVNAVAIARLASRDVIVTGGADGNVATWDAPTGQLIGDPLPTGHGSVTALALGRAAGRDVIVTAGSDGTARIWDAGTGEPTIEPVTAGRAWLQAVALGQLAGQDVIVTAGQLDAVRVWDAGSGESAREPLADQAYVQAVALGQVAGRDVIVTAGGDATVRIWDATSGQLAMEPLAGHHGSVSAAVLGQIGSRTVIVTGGADGTVRIWDATTGEPVGRPLTGHDGSVQAVALGQAGGRDVIVTGGAEGAVRIWDVSAGGPAGDPPGRGDGLPTAVALGQVSGRDVIVTGGYDGLLRVWDATTAEQVLPGGPLAAHPAAVLAVVLGQVAGQDVIVSGGGRFDETVRVWSAATGEAVTGPLPGYNGSTLALGRVAGRDVIVAGLDRDEVQVWDAITGATAASWPTGHGAPVRAVALGQVAGRDVIVTGSGDGTVQLWDAITGEPAGNPLAGYHRWVLGVALGRVAGRDVIVSGGGDSSGDQGTVRLWDAITGQPTGSQLTGQRGAVLAVTLSQLADGRGVIVVGGFDEDGIVGIWDPATGSPVGKSVVTGPRPVLGVALGQVTGRDLIVSVDDALIVWTRQTQSD